MEEILRKLEEELQHLHIKSENASSDNFKYVYANQGIGIMKAIRIIKGEQ